MASARASHQICAQPSPHIVVTRKKPRGNKLALKKLPCKPLLPAPLR